MDASFRSRGESTNISKPKCYGMALPKKYGPVISSWKGGKLNQFFFGVL
jgi:hypothetical protein